MKALSSAPDRALRGTALLRIDVNATDGWRLEAVIPTIEYLAKRAKKVIVISHKGRPAPGQRLGKLSLWSDAEALASLVKPDVWFISDTSIPDVRRELGKIPDGTIVMLENIRAFRGEAGDADAFARSLASLGDYYVSDAFPVLHHPAASVTGLPKLLPSYAGLRLVEEVKRLSALQERVRHPYVVVIGGAKAQDKLGVLSACLEKADLILVGGASANALLALSGAKVGASVYERDPKLLAALKPFVGNKKIILPTDFVRSGGKILDIGPKTARLFARKLAGARTILWTGPLGLIEKKRFEKGSLAVARAIAKNKKAFSVTGGGETVSFLKKHGLDRKFSFISTGGGALIDFVSGKELPGLRALSGRRKPVAAPKKSPKAAKRATPKDRTPKLAPVYDIFFHDDMDGRASAAVFVNFLKTRKSRIQRFIPVQHDMKETWVKKNALDIIAGTKKRNPAIIVDFPYHPQAAIWFDHHPPAFLVPAWGHAFQQNELKRVDPSYPSACRYIVDSLARDFGYEPPKHIRELGKWLDVTDGGLYDSAFQTIALREPILQVNAYVDAAIGNVSKAGGLRDPLVWLIESLAMRGIVPTSRDKRVVEVMKRIKDETKNSLSFYRRNLKVKGTVGVVDISELTTRRLRYAPYYLAPNTMFAIMSRKRTDGSYIVQVGANPWKRDRNPFEIGAALTKFGGGGHAYAGAVRVPDQAALDRVLDYFITLFNGTTH